MKKFLLVGFACTLAVSGVRADVVAGWEMSGTGTSNNDGLLPVSTVANETVTGLVRTGVKWTTAGNSFNSNNSWNLTTSFDPTTAADYFSFTVTPSAGNSLTLTSLQYAMNGSNSAPKNGVWGYTTDGGVDWTTTAFTLANATPTLATWDFSDFTVSAGTTVQFRFWAYGSGLGNQIGGTIAPSASGTVRIANVATQDLVLNGSVTAVPEPATYGLIVGGALALLVFARRGKKSATHQSA